MHSGQRRAAIAAAAAALLFSGVVEAVEPKQEPSPAVEAAVDELAAIGAVTPAEAAALRAWLWDRLQLGPEEPGSCPGGEEAECREQVRTQIRACHVAGETAGVVGNSEQAADLAVAVLMLRAQPADAARQAGEVVQRQLASGWQVEGVREAAEAIHRLRQHRRWQQEAWRMLRQCSLDQACSALQADAALRVMGDASKRADLDPRRTRRTLERALGRGTTVDDDGEMMRARLRKRLRLARGGEADEIAAGAGAYQSSYRFRMTGEAQLGGDYGGQSSAGPGLGFDKSPGPGKGKER